MKLFLLVLQNDKQLAKIPINKNITTVGRSIADIKIPDPWLSPRHLMIRVMGKDISIRDFSTKNGTIINGQKIIGDQNIYENDEIYLGNLILKIIFEQGSHETFQDNPQPKRETIIETEPAADIAIQKKEEKITSSPKPGRKSMKKGKRPPPPPRNLLPSDYETIYQTEFKPHNFELKALL